MSMKFFTLSAICVLVYCLLLALSGVSGLNEAELDGWEKLRLGNQRSLAVDPKNSSIETATSKSESPVQLLDEWKGVNAETRKANDRNYGRQVRTFGILFILGWVVISFKLLDGE